VGVILVCVGERVWEYKWGEEKENMGIGKRVWVGGLKFTPN
jgi:hypothetical protein